MLILVVAIPIPSVIFIYGFLTSAGSLTSTKPTIGFITFKEDASKFIGLITSTYVWFHHHYVNLWMGYLVYIWPWLKNLILNRERKRWDIGTLMKHPIISISEHHANFPRFITDKLGKKLFRAPQKSNKIDQIHRLNPTKGVPSTGK